MPPIGVNTMALLGVIGLCVAGWWVFLVILDEYIHGP
jgi:hypothetical protein